MVQTSLFIALCFVGTLVSIPFGASKVHLGNLLCLLAGLLCGPWVGGISGGVGMLFADLPSGYPYTTYLRTFVLKFSMGFLIGWLYRLLLKKDVKGTGLLFAGAVVSSLLFGGGLSFYLLKPEDPYGLPLLILSSVLFGFFLAAFCFLKKLDPSKKILLFSLLCALGRTSSGSFSSVSGSICSLGWERKKRGSSLFPNSPRPCSRQSSRSSGLCFCSIPFTARPPDSTP